MFTLMYVAQRQSHLTPVSISKLPHMLFRRISITERGLCVGKPSMGISFWPALRMRNLIFRSFSVSAMIFMPLHICRLKKKTEKSSHPFVFCLGRLFDYISINWWQFYVCTFQHLSALQMFIFTMPAVILVAPWKFVSISSPFLFFQRTLNVLHYFCVSVKVCLFRITILLYCWDVFELYKNI